MGQMDITAKGGELDGLTFSIVEGTETFTHHAAPGGHYKVNVKTATWVEDSPAVKAAKTRAENAAEDEVDGDASGTARPFKAN